MRQTLRSRAVLLAIAALALCSPFTCWAQTRSRLIHAIDASVPVNPAPVRIAGKRHLGYELHITNFRPLDITLTRVEVLDADRGNRLAAFQDSELASRLGRPGAADHLKDKRVIGAGMRAVIFFWLPLDEAIATPSKLLHRIELDVMRPTGIEHTVVELTPSAVLNDTAIVLNPPLRGGPWVAVYDPALEHGHRTSIYAINGRARIPARFAIDWIKLDNRATRARGDTSRITNWHGYGAEVLAVADSIVADAKDDMTEDESLSAAKARTFTLENASGNSITLDLGGGRYAFYQHLKHGSIKVRVGDRVKSGDVIALLGNSGSSSSGPHLHFHVGDGNIELASEGIPYVFRQFNVLGAYESLELSAGGQPWQPVPQREGGTRSMELPDARTVIMFE